MQTLWKTALNHTWNDGQCTWKTESQWDFTLWYITKQWGLCYLLIWFLIFFGSAIRISRKGWHMLLNFCFHTALTFAVFAGGINRIKYPIICQAVSAFPFHSSHSQSLAENWLWMSTQVLALAAVCGGSCVCHASAACMTWSLFYLCADTMSPDDLSWINPLCPSSVCLCPLMLVSVGHFHIIFVNIFGKWSYIKHFLVIRIP